MNPFERMSDPVTAEIRNELAAYQGRTLPVYAVAEAIRKRRERENIALEDIVERLIREGRIYNVSFEIDPMQAADALRGNHS